MTAKEKLLFVSSFIWFFALGNMSLITHYGYGYSKNSVRMLPLGL